jgi:hypothetical protein
MQSRSQANSIEFFARTIWLSKIDVVTKVIVDRTGGLRRTNSPNFDHVVIAGGCSDREY